MTIRLAVVSTARNTDRIVEEIRRSAGERVEVALHIGDVTSDLKASSVTRLNTRKGGQGHLFANQRWTGAGQVLRESPEFVDKMEEFIDHLHRRSDINSHKSHPLRTMQDYADYYHILADVIAEALIARNITHCLFFNVPHLTYDTIVYQIARAMGLPTMIVTQSLFPGCYFSMAAVNDFGAFAPQPSAAPYPIEKGSMPDLFYMSGIKQEREEGGRLNAKAVAQLIAFLALKRPLKALNPFYVRRLLSDMRRVYGALPKWRDPFARFFHEDQLAYYDHLATFEDQQLDLSGDFVYFPLQLQPEMTTAALGGRFHDQAYAIEELASILPEGVRILVKENPKQGAYMRGPMFFHRLRRIPSVTFLPSWANTHELTARARFVATITGTVGWEAIRAGKPALVFGKAWYRKLPGVFEWDAKPAYEAIASAEIDHPALESAVGALLAGAHHGVVDRHYTKLVPELDEPANARATAKEIVDLIEGRRAPTFPPREGGGSATPTGPFAPAAADADA
jgi:hypothetical protein